MSSVFKINSIEKAKSRKINGIADKWIAELKANGYDYDGMLVVFRLASEKVKQFNN